MGLFDRFKKYDDIKKLGKLKKTEEKEIKKLEKGRKKKIGKLKNNENNTEPNKIDVSNKKIESIGKIDFKKSDEDVKGLGGYNDNFSLKQFNFNDGFESVIEISYGVPRESKVKLFFSTNEFTTFSRNYAEKISDNFVRLIIAPSTRINASLISGGNFDFNTSDDKGYSLFVSMRREDSKLLAVISNVLRSENFGCLPARFTISAHRKDNFPTDSMAMEILSKLNYKLSTTIQDMKD